MRALRRVLATAAVVAAAVAGAVVGPAIAGPAPAHAATSTSASTPATDATTFDAGAIISDADFFNSTAMGASDIQSFLAAKETGCTASNGQPCLKDATFTTTSHAADSYCSAITGATGESAATVLAEVGVACGINPQVLVVLLQKEQGLVTATAPTATAYRSATGYGCPDTSACDSTYYGFVNQVWNAAHQFQVYTKTSSRWSYQPGRTNNILYNPSASCGSKSVYIENQATANLYIYTPYTPNQAALAARYGTGDSCSSYGNRNFFLYFNDWFARSPQLLHSPGFEANAADGWGWSNGFANRLVARSPAQAHSGDYFLATNAPAAGRATTQDVVRSGAVGETVTASVWLRAESGSYTGRVDLWGIGGVQENAEQAFTVGTTWTQVSVTLPVKQAGHTLTRLDIYMDTVGNTLWIDDASLTVTPPPVLQNVLQDPGFENGLSPWQPGNGFINNVVYPIPSIARSGNAFLAMNTSVPNRSMSQTVAVTPTTGDRWTFGAWVRSSTSDPFSGRIAVWTFGGALVNGMTSFTVGSTWTYVSATVDVPAGTTALKAELYLDTVGTTLWTDDGSLSRNLLTAGSFEGPSTSGWTWSTTNLVVYGSGAGGVNAVHGSSYVASNTTRSGTSIAQNVIRRPVVGETYTAEVWVRSASGAPFAGRLALWQFGGTVVAASQPFTATDTWQKVTVPLTISDAATTSLRFELFEDQTSGTLDIDAAQLY